MKHLIGKQVLDLTVSPSADAFKLQHQLSQFYWNKMVPELDSLFDQLSSETEVVSIDRLEIDLGQFTEEGILQEGFLEQLRQQLEIQLRDILRGKGSSKTDRTPASFNLFEQWLFFLNKGYLPWSSRQLPTDWVTSVLDTLGTNSQAVVNLRQLLRTQPTALQRLIVQHATTFLKTLVELFTGKKQAALLAAETELQKLPAPYWAQVRGKVSTSISQRQIGLFFWKEVLETTIVLDHKLEAPTLIGRILGSHFSVRTLKQLQEAERAQDYPVLFSAIGEVTRTEAKQVPEKNLAKDTPIASQEEAMPIPEASEDPNAPEEKQRKRKEKIISIESKTNRDQPIAAEEKQQLGQDTPGKETSESTFPFETDLKEAYLRDRARLEKEEFFLENAGVVLLHPFLTSLFRKLDYVEGGAFKSETDRHRAIHLIHFLATGELEVPEYSLLLPKFLCGLPFNLPLDHTLQPSKQEQEEANSMLQAAITHWKVLQNTSPDGLREGFLQREGKLFQDAGGWCLQVENKTLDILLNQLPWGIGVIKLPWMVDMLRVEWG